MDDFRGENWKICLLTPVNYCLTTTTKAQNSTKLHDGYKLSPVDFARDLTSIYCNQLQPYWINVWTKQRLPGTPACRLHRGEHLWWSLRFVRGYGVTQWCVWCIIIPLPRDTWDNEQLGSRTKWIRLSIVSVKRWNSYKCPKPRCDLSIVIRQRWQGRYRVKQKSEKRVAANVLKRDWNTQLWKRIETHSCEKECAF